MVVLFSNRKSKTEKEIIDILCSHGGDYISDKAVNLTNGRFTIISEYKVTNLNIKNGIAVILDDTERFKGQKFPNGIIGICEENNLLALKLFAESSVPVICCGAGTKNTITISSINNDFLLAALQRTITDTYGAEIEPSEYKISLTKKYQPLSVMIALAILLLKGIAPSKF